ncbi:hypothetical protein FE391_08015 [Nonomuraea sp. KC401]|uniref:DUF6286 domain-containing protein n=1 Tax=unclassified Nonomuraea TaxID=2593643 RepID=UPI0010FDF44E|nr:MULTISPECIES: DUF6286 domain-containing protein [unclassified Nonomuraea]NBE96097.1 hypothetical protein [Nonomuraea sp. K271]TLF80295.1 hypothetical protein FE391_08015 [Nonomuraea sp. KC401]
MSTQEMCTVPPDDEGGSHRAAPSRRARPAGRATDRAAVRAFRPRRRIPAIVAGLLLMLLGLLVAAETISGLVGRPLRLVPYDGMLAWASATLWSNPLFLLASAVVTLLGLALLAAALVPGRPGMVPVRSGDPGLIVGLRTRTVARALAHAAEEVPGVHAARARMRGSTVVVTAATSGWDKERFGTEVRDAVLTRLAAMEPVEPYRVVVNVKETR